MAVLGWPKTLAWKDFGAPRATVPTSYQGTHTDCHIETDISFSFTVASPTVKGRLIIEKQAMTRAFSCCELSGRNPWA